MRRRELLLTTDKTDTGSSQFWVASQDCSTCTSAGMEVAPLSTSPGCEPLTQYYGEFPVFEMVQIV